MLLNYAKNGDLSKRCKEILIKNSYFSEIEIRSYLAQMALAIKYLHENHILHRDIKLNNILIDEFGHFKLSDFGISTKLGEDKLAETSVGTPYYLSPEIITNIPYDHKSDIWMFGCTLYELTTGRKPFEGESLQEIFFKVMNEDPLPIPEKYSFFIRNLVK